MKAVRNRPIAEEHLGIARKAAYAMAKKHRRYTWDQLMEWALLGLDRAIRMYDPGYGTTFSTYAYVACYRTIINNLDQEENILRHYPLEIDKKLYEDSETRYIDEMVDEEPGPEERLIKKEEIREQREAVERALEPLNQREIDIVSLYYGLRGEPMTLQKIGDKYGVTRQRISAQIKEALVKMRGALNDEGNQV